MTDGWIICIHNLHSTVYLIYLGLMKLKILDQCMSKPDAQGVIFVVSTPIFDKYGNPGGTNVDDKNICDTFCDDLNFAVCRVQNPSFLELDCLLEAAVKFCKYPLNYNFIAFYYAGHGGIDKCDDEFVLPLQPIGGRRKDVVYIKDIISRFTCKYVQIRDKSFFNEHKRYRKCLFFFDCCLNYNRDLVVRSKERVFNLHCPQDCLVAYATSNNFISQGDKVYGGRWTHHLCRHLKKRDLLSVILDRTAEDVRKDQARNIEKDQVIYQLPHYTTNAGEIYLKGN